MLLQDGEFKFYSAPVLYKIIRVTAGGYIRNKLSGENCGNVVKLYKSFYDEDGNLLESPIVDEDIYEVVYDAADN
jgi:hypothetical protein